MAIHPLIAFLCPLALQRQSTEEHAEASAPASLQKRRKDKAHCSVKLAYGVEPDMQLRTARESGQTATR